MDECQHADYMRETYKDFPMKPGTCDNLAPHDPHGTCLGMMCDWGCNDNGQFYAGLVVTD
jgi:hypothetical protein